jgi:hypothetical protein
MEVSLPAKHGKTYAGLVTRDNDTQEALGQALTTPLLSGHCYLLRFHAARSTSFSSYSRTTELPADFSGAVRLQLWAGKDHCQMQELLAETTPIRDTSWKTYELLFSPREEYDQFFFKATYVDDSDVYNGHVLIDHLSPILELECAASNTLELESISSVPAPGEAPNELSALIEKELPKIKWVHNGFTLEQQLLPSNSDPASWIYGNLGIYQITQLLKNNPDALITIAVGPRKDPLQQHHIRLLAAEFMAAGLSPRQCLIRPIKKRDERKTDWLRAPDGSVDILWGVDY